MSETQGPSIPELPVSDTGNGHPRRVELGTLRHGGDPCYTCSICDSVCPVVPFDAEFPGPKAQGPEQWRLRSPDTTIDSSVDACSNCLRCHAACPEDVELAAMHTVAREERLEDRSFSLKYLRDRLLANYGTLARVASKTPRMTNWLANNSWLRAALERTLGITAEREAPAFAHESFREWWRKRGGARVKSEEARVAYFHGDYANYHTPEVGKALVTVYEAAGYEVAVPEQRCSGTPMFANGFLDDAERAARFNVEQLVDYIDDGYDIVATCTSCSLALREEYPDLFSFEGIETVSANTYDAIDYLRASDVLDGVELDAGEIDGMLSYHAPCHASAQGVDGRSIPILEEAGVSVTDLGDGCSGMSGTYGWKDERYDTSMAIGEDTFEAMEASPGERGITECPTCAMQMEHGTGYEVSHPIELVAEALDSI